jgi:hypothetical protein
MRKAIRPPSLNLEQMAAWESDELDPDYWQRLIFSDPEDVCRRAMVSFNKEHEAYTLRFLGQTYKVYPYLRKLARAGKREANAPYRRERIPFGEALVLLNYLLRAKEVPLFERWVTEKDLPGGALFFRGPRKLPTEPVLERYGRDPEGLLEAGRLFGAESLRAGDAALRLQVLPRVPLNYVLWREDEEFPPRLTVAFDASLTEHFPLDVVWALVHVVSNRLACSQTNGGVCE